MPAETWIEVAASLEAAINKVMDDAYPHDWNEDFLSRDLLRQVRGCFQSRPYLRGWENLRITMECWKQTGNQEANFGDIGLLVTIAHRGLSPITGAAYLEAKRRLPRTARFPEIRTGQAKRIRARAPKAAFLLFDYEYSTQFVGPLGRYPWSWRDGPVIASSIEALPVVKVRVVPLDTALAANAKDTSLYCYGLPFSHQLVSRYFCGLDLEFSKDAVQSLAGFGRKLLPKRLAVINVVEGGGDVEAPKVNEQLYKREE
jgi:hypothetical protein